VNAYGVALAVFAMVVVSCTPALALEREAVMEQGGAEPHPEDTSGGEVTMKCPNCGERIVVGRHGQTGQTTVCPFCGAEICPGGVEKAFCTGADAGFFSKYVSRGVVTTDGPVFQPGVWVSYRDVTISVWGNMDLTDTNGNGGRFNELDFTLDYSREWGKLDFSAGGVYYDFPNTTAAGTAELYAGVGYDTLLHPVIAVYYDFLEADGFYLSAGIGHGFDIPLPADTVKAALELSAQAGWGSKNFNEFNFGSSHGAFTDMVFSAALPVSAGDNLVLKPVVSYSSVLDGTIRTKNGQDDNLVWGIVASGSF